MIKPICKDIVVLSQPSAEATKEDIYLAEDLRDTLEYYKKECVGMAANMIGVNKRVIIVNIGFVNLVMFNPVMTAKSIPFEAEESCLSLLGHRKAKRYQQIEIEYFDEKWLKKKLPFSGLPAQIIQHELDHLEGIVI
ncbi:peptide deformylase [Streptococcus dentiloxodontae]